MMMKSFRKSRRGWKLAVVLIGAVPIMVKAQYRVNTQIYGGSGSVRIPTSIQIPSATYQTPSQVRMAIHASGATPSQLKTEYNRIGPLAPSGAIAYVPPAPNYFTKPAASISSGNYVNAQVGTAPKASYSTAISPPRAPSNSFPSSSVSGSIRYSSSPAPSYTSSPTSWSQMSSGGSSAQWSSSLSGSPMGSYVSGSTTSSLSGSLRYSQ